jgi:DNA-binding transcriptional LysR family regulator
MRTKFEFQLAGLGFGFLPEACARPAIERGLLVAKEVAEPKADETFYLAWRSGEEGAALTWWIERVRETKPFDRMNSVGF